ncbi:hypothetical protein PHAVU_008G240100 [Phaseolus vulgaris]|uniref:Uncharacterized protein n=1 Tax=Phaseolus vulgaris TaxID=3885 RepID=V7B7Z8_PHAVU|nr:hypothetical protein PHAVU_008G240100g [Phaseolus vulgaris]ESW13949.1 hypothetical protein PHAVU_008G240100g [Phaseolus vulgaris]
MRRKLCFGWSGLIGFGTVIGRLQRPVSIQHKDVNSKQLLPWWILVVIIVMFLLVLAIVTAYKVWRMTGRSRAPTPAPLQMAEERVVEEASFPPPSLSSSPSDPFPLSFHNGR